MTNHRPVGGWGAVVSVDGHRAPTQERYKDAGQEDSGGTGAPQGTALSVDWVVTGAPVGDLVLLSFEGPSSLVRWEGISGDVNSTRRT